MNALPETILQFGGGRFLRAFADLFVHQANAEGQQTGRIVVVQSTEGERARLLNAQAGRYHVLVRGLERGEKVDRVEACGSIRRALVAQAEWEAVLAVARAPELGFVLSNTTEAGYSLDPADRPDSAPPRAFPARLLQLLRARFDSGAPGLTLLPCELIEDNADRLQAAVLDLARAWSLPARFQEWLRAECCWHNTLVDRIVTNAPPDHPLAQEDKLLIAAEPFAFWAIAAAPEPPALCAHPAIHQAADIQPYFLRKVRILNGAHTALAVKAQARGLATVREAVQDPAIRAWLERLLFEEIVPTLEGRVEAPEAFARQTLERFANPFLEHRIADIAVNHDKKVPIRLVPTRDEFREKFGRTPPLLEEAISA
ncbi:MAG TPA: tagaturonate reductase [Chthonomonadaceae bacterium]|nr:tagaturonate reductase [Chthonomonadaceae bacterium]